MKIVQAIISAIALNLNAIGSGIFSGGVYIKAAKIIAMLPSPKIHNQYWAKVDFIIPSIEGEAAYFN
jgi:hypothetical protein|tara:strand:+ start:240 stop:440 length:201 start_codon:yes stop_codon:yes gene_type:complete